MGMARRRVAAKPVECDGRAYSGMLRFNGVSTATLLLGWLIGGIGWALIALLLTWGLFLLLVDVAD